MKERWLKHSIVSLSNQIKEGRRWTEEISEKESRTRPRTDGTGSEVVYGHAHTQER